MIRGDILRADTETLVNTVNCVGVMGRGIAAQFKKQFDENFKAYKKACNQNQVRLGTVFIYDYQLLRPRYIINFPTKGHWRSKSRLPDIEAGLEHLTAEVRRRQLPIPQPRRKLPRSRQDLILSAPPDPAAR